ncbi:MAG: HD domain-containing protein [Ruthenibacterium sp.]
MIRRNQADVCNIALPDDREYLLLVKDIIHHPSFALMQQFIQHGTTSCLEHCINVSYLSYLYCKRIGLNTRSVARAGLLHDLFLYDWHYRHRVKGERLHGFEHPRKALKNAEEMLSLNEMEKNIILRHMWPLTLTPPRYKEAYIVVWFDKYCSLMETLHRPVMRLLSEKDTLLAVACPLPLHDCPAE